MKCHLLFVGATNIALSNYVFFLCILSLCCIITNV